MSKQSYTKILLIILFILLVFKSISAREVFEGKGVDGKISETSGIYPEEGAIFITTHPESEVKKYIGSPLEKALEVANQSKKNLFILVRGWGNEFTGGC